MSAPGTVTAPPTSAAAPAWFVTTPRLRPGVSLRLFAFPYAGGGAGIYRAWTQHLPARVELCPVRLPGREMRRAEPPARHLPALLDQLVAALLPCADEPYAFFGHSMGAILAYECARRLAGAGRPARHLFVAARHAPQVPRRILPRPVQQLGDGEFLDHLGAAGAHPALAHAELAALVLPVLRADFELCQDYAAPQVEPLPMPVTAFGGRRDPAVESAHLDAWRDCAGGDFKSYVLDGDHLFVNSAGAELCRLLMERLSAPWPRARSGGEVR